MALLNEAQTAAAGVRRVLGVLETPVEVSFASLPARVISVPQDGFLFDAGIADNIRYGRPDATDAQVLELAGAYARLHADWAAGTA